MKVLLLILFLAVPALTQVEPDFFADYDKFKEMSFVGFKGGRVRRTDGPDTYFNVSAIYRFPGQKRTKPPASFVVVFSANVEQVTFKNNHDLTLLIDNGKPIRFGNGEYERKVTDEGFTETIGFIMTRAQVSSIAKASKVEVQIGNFEGELWPSTISGFKRLIDN